MARQIIKYSSQSIFLVIIMIGILFFANILSARFFVRADLTENKEYTITDATRNILSNLDDIVNIRFYLSKDLPSYVANLEKQVRDLLEEYEAYAGGNLMVEFIDPSSDPELKQKVQRLGIPELQLRVIEKDQQQIRKAYLGISVQYGDKSEIIPVIKSIENMEYELTSALFKVTDTKKRMIGWLGAGTPAESDPNGYDAIKKILGEEYMVRPLDPAKIDAIQKNIDLVVVPGSVELPERAMYAVDQFIMNGGQAVFLLDAVSLESQTVAASAATQSITPLLSHYGVDIQPNLIVDRYNAYASFNNGYMRFTVPYPFWPKILPENFNPEIPSVSNLESLVLPWVSPLDVHDLKGQFEYEILAQTSSGSAALSEPFDLNPQQRFEFNPEDAQQFVIAVSGAGKLPSFFEGKSIPPKNTPNPDDDPEETPILISENSKIVVIASTRLVNNQFLSLFADNAVFFQNICDSLAIGDALIGIRSRQVTARPIDFGTTDEKDQEGIKRTHRFLGIFGMPIFAVAFGLIRLSVRNKRKKLGELGIGE